MSITSIIIALADTYCFLIFVYVMMSWFPIGEGILSDIYRTLGKLCDPYLDLFKRFIPPIGGMIDISPIIAFFVLQFGVRLLVSLF